MSTLEEVARFCEPGHAAQLPQDLVHREDRRRRRACTSCATAGARPLHRQGREPAAPHARPLPAAPGVPRPPGAGTARAHRRRRDGSEFGALLLESRLIGKHRPPYNSHGTRARQLPLRQAQRRGVPAPVRDAQPARRRLVLRRAVPQGVHGPALVEASPAPTRCAPARGCPRRRAPATGKRRPSANPRPAGRGRARLRARRYRRLPLAVPATGRRGVRRRGRGGAPRARGRRPRRRPSASGAPAVMVERLAFEQAARLQRQREALERALRGVRRLRAAAHDDLVLTYPAPTPGWVRLWGVSCGASRSPQGRSRRARSRSTARAVPRRGRHGRAAADRRSRRPPSTRCCWCTPGGRCSATWRPRTCSRARPRRGRRRPPRRHPRRTHLTRRGVGGARPSVRRPGRRG